MTVKFFDAMEVESIGIRELIKRSLVSANAEVWRGADGSYAIGDPQDIYDELGDDNEDILDLYTEAGLVEDYL
jgi:hypothetical protein